MLLTIIDLGAYTLPFQIGNSEHHFKPSTRFDRVTRDMEKIINPSDNQLTDEEKDHLRLWSSTTPLQRLEWLEEIQILVYQAGAWPKDKKYD